MPKYINIHGYARTAMTSEKFRDMMTPFLKKGNDLERDAFLNLCTYSSGLYDSAASFADLDAKLLAKEDELITKMGLDGLEASGAANRLFYLAIPPSIFVDSGRSIKASALTSRGWNRVIVEKPFGHDLESSRALAKDLSSLFEENQVYRIDHYLGKEMVQNLIVLRFGNSLFEPLWNRSHISSVQITFKEPIGTQGRGGYFDPVGIIRDVMQNHLLQIACLVAMEPPVTLSAEDVRDEKVKVLRSAPPLRLEDTILGQYVANEAGDAGYLDDPTVPKDSITPTFAMCVLYFNSARWEGVPFILKCGKGLNERKAEVRIQFKDRPGGLFQGENESKGFAHRNELVMRVQPDEAIYFKMNIKAPGLSTHAVMSELDLSYKTKFENRLPDAYERLILDTIRGDHSNFVRGDELDVSWKIFTPLLHEIERKKVKPQPYVFGTRGPEDADVMKAKLGYKRTTSYSWGQTPKSKLSPGAKSAL
jgi:glucose-6-phosphate 1-dehydrogenase